MHLARSSILFWVRLLLSGLVLPCSAADQTAAPPRYEYRDRHDPDGIGKFYMGREIAHVMGHGAADWLERPEREQEENTSLLMKSLQIQPGMVVADIGAGSGYYTRRMAKQVGPGGKVLAVDIQPEMLELLTNGLAKLQITNVQPILGTITDPMLPPASVDLVLMVDVYHEFSHPYEMMEGICRGLKPGGRVAYVEFRREDPAVPIKELHKMTEAQVHKEAAAHALEWVQTVETLPRQHLIFFRRTASPKPPTAKALSPKP
jgi:SAM-dependent methyltransferase